jgi:hypothetical protein
MLASSRLVSAGLVTALVAGVPTGLVADGTLAESPSRLDVFLTTATTLSPSARASMMNEAATIWRQHGVVINWLHPAIVRPLAPDRLRVLIVQKRLLTDKAAEPVAVGELVRPPNGHPVALISIEGARRMVANARGRAGNEMIAVDERRLGIVLGRALAHEIGHYLLDTHTHARSGLMRPQFNALEFTDLRDGTFALDQDAAAWLRTRDAGKFVYAQR